MLKMVHGFFHYFFSWLTQRIESKFSQVCSFMYVVDHTKHEHSLWLFFPALPILYNTLKFKQLLLSRDNIISFPVCNMNNAYRFKSIPQNAPDYLPFQPHFDYTDLNGSNTRSVPNDEGMYFQIPWIKSYSDTNNADIQQNWPCFIKKNVNDTIFETQGRLETVKHRGDLENFTKKVKLDAVYNLLAVL